MATIPPLTTGYTLEEAEEDIADLRGQVDAMDEVISLLDGPIPNSTPISGCQLYSTNGQPTYVNFTGLVMSMQGAQPATFPVITATAASLTSIGSFSIPANDADIGAVYELELWGNGKQGTTKQALGVQVVLGGNNLASVTFGPGAFQTASNFFRFRVKGRGICHTTGATGAWTSFLDAQVSDLDGGAGSNPISAGNQNFATATSCESTGTTAIDTTAAITLGVSVAWGTVTGAPTLTSQVAIAKRIC